MRSLATWSMQRVGACMHVSGSVHRRGGMTSGFCAACLAIDVPRAARRSRRSFRSAMRWDGGFQGAALVFPATTWAERGIIGKCRGDWRQVRRVEASFRVNQSWMLTVIGWPARQGSGPSQAGAAVAEYAELNTQATRSSQVPYVVSTF